MLKCCFRLYRTNFCTQAVYEIFYFSKTAWNWLFRHHFTDTGRLLETNKYFCYALVLPVSVKWLLKDSEIGVLDLNRIIGSLKFHTFLGVPLSHHIPAKNHPPPSLRIKKRNLSVCLSGYTFRHALMSHADILDIDRGHIFRKHRHKNNEKTVKNQPLLRFLQAGCYVARTFIAKF